MTRQKKFQSCFFISFFFFLIPCYATLTYSIPQVIRKIPHDPQAFTQGLAIDQNQIYESTGHYGQSSLRLLHLQDGHLIQSIKLPNQFFAEGLAIVNHQIFQLTWREKQAFIYQQFPFKLISMLSYEGEGWGLCHDQQTLWMSNGTSTLVQRDPKNFNILRKIQVFFNQQPLEGLNDLECVGEWIYANVWRKDWIVKIDKQTGHVRELIDASYLLNSNEKMALGAESVLNGIAFHPTTQTFYLTGKNWPWLFEVQLGLSNTK